MTNLPVKPIADAQKLTAILEKNLKIVDTYIQRRQEMNEALQALENQKGSVKTESKDALMQQKLELEGELPQHLGRIQCNRRSFKPGASRRTLRPADRSGRRGKFGHQPAVYCPVNCRRALFCT